MRWCVYRLFGKTSGCKCLFSFKCWNIIFKEILRWTFAFYAPSNTHDQQTCYGWGNQLRNTLGPPDICYVRWTMCFGSLYIPYTTPKYHWGKMHIAISSMHRSDMKQTHVNMLLRSSQVLLAVVFSRMAVSKLGATTRAWGDDTKIPLGKNL